MTITLESANRNFAAEVRGVNLTQHLDEETVQLLIDAIDRYAVLVFRDQPLTDEQHLAFAQRLGKPETAATRFRLDRRERLDLPQFADISNLDENDEVFDADDWRRMRAIGNRLWHTDSSFRLPSGRYSMLSAKVVPGEGGETEYADMRAAYDALPDPTKARIDGLEAEHSIMYSRSQIGFSNFSPEEYKHLPPVPQPLVRLHPGSNRKSLYIASHASHIVGMRIPEGRLLLRDLIEFATQPHFVYRHRWRPGDLVIWDNRCTMHRARPFDETLRRDLRRVTTADVA